MTTPPTRGRSTDDVHDETWTISTADGELGVRVRRPVGQGQFPVVLLFHHGPGLDAGTLEAMGILAGDGNFVVAPDRYYRNGPWITFDSTELLGGSSDSEVMKRLFTLMSTNTDDMIERDVQAVLGRLAADPAARQGPMGCVGYCIGARSVLRTLDAHPDTFGAGVLLHPSRCVEDGPDSPHTAVPDFPGELYVAIGAADHMSSPESNRPLIEAVDKLADRGIVEIHDGANHGFAVPGAGYHKPAADRSYEQAIALFNRVLI